MPRRYCTDCHAHVTTHATGVCRACRARNARVASYVAPDVPAISFSLIRLTVVREHVERPREQLSKPEQVATMFRSMVDVLDREVFMAFFLDARHQINGAHVVSVGSLSASIVHPRECFKVALLHNAAGVVFAHNHPSDDPEPSPEDIAVTKRLREAGELLGVEVLDHVVVATSSFVSLRARAII